MTLEEAIGTVIRQERKEQKLTLVMLSLRMGGKPDPGNLCRLENGKGGSPTLRTLERICDGLGLPTLSLFTRVAARGFLKESEGI